MKLKIWIGPLIAVIILATLRPIMYNAMQDEKQRSVIPAVKKQPSEVIGLSKMMPELNSPMAGTRLLTDTLPF